MSEVRKLHDGEVPGGEMSGTAGCEGKEGREDNARTGARECGE